MDRIYSFAATLYFLITDRVPPPGAARLDQDAYVPITSLAPSGYRQSFLLAIDHAMRLVPADRPHSVREWSQGLFRDRGAGEEKRASANSGGAARRQTSRAS
ncbi:MAG: hypothetical protein HC850_09915, partial [Rhodomicrobium sp.]|nr:hypothetical protein [Rhodomicrobium sp.]